VTEGGESRLREGEERQEQEQEQEHEKPRSTAALEATIDYLSNSHYSDAERRRKGALEWRSSEALLVSPRHALAVCVPFKAASAQWRRFMFALEGLEFKSFGALPKTGTREQRAAIMPSGQAQEEALQDPEMRTAVIVRDPMERLLSAYLEKCLLNKTMQIHDKHCLNFPKSTPTFPAFVKRLEAAVHKHEINLRTVNIHYRLQSATCDRSGQWYSGYRYVVRMGGDAPALSDQVGVLARAVGIAPRTALDFFPRESAAPHRTGAAGAALEHYDLETADAARALYREDYEHFDVPLPSWFHLLR